MVECCLCCKKEAIVPQNNGSWIEPRIIAAELRIQEACLRHLAESRSDMPPAVNGWLEQIAEIARALSDYADGYRPASKPEESVTVMDDG